MEVKVGDCVEVGHLGDDATRLLQLKALWSEPTQTRSRMQALGQYFYRAEVAISSSSHCIVFTLQRHFGVHIGLTMWQVVTSYPVAVNSTALWLQAYGHLFACRSMYVAQSAVAVYWKPAQGSSLLV